MCIGCGRNLQHSKLVSICDLCWNKWDRAKTPFSISCFCITITSRHNKTDPLNLDVTLVLQNMDDNRTAFIAFNTFGPFYFRGSLNRYDKRFVYGGSSYEKDDIIKWYESEGILLLSKPPYAEDVTDLYVIDADLSSDLSSWINLKWFIYTQKAGDYSVIDLSKNTKLKYIDANTNSKLLGTQELMNIEFMYQIHSPIAEMQCDITELDISGQMIPDVQALFSLTQLKKLDCSNNKIVDLSCIFAMEKLEYIDFHHNQVKKLFINIKNVLRHINAHNNDLRELNVTHLKNLEYLNIGCNKIRFMVLDLCVMKSLKVFISYKCKIQELRAIRHMNLERIDGSYGRIYTVALHESPRLRYVNLSNSGVTYINMMELTLNTLNLDCCLLTELEMNRVSSIVSLSCDNCHIEKISGLIVRDLKYLRCANTLVKEIPNIGFILIEDIKIPPAVEEYAKKELEKFDSILHPVSDENQYCCICYDDDDLRETKCRHVFHRGCLARAILSNPTCAMCRRELF